MNQLYFREVAGSALYCNCVSWGIRESKRAWTKKVLTATFEQFEQAKQFSLRWAGIAYGFCAIRRHGQDFTVSVPVWGEESL